MPPIIEARNLFKKYGDLVAVKGVDFSVESRECFAFLGPNGAGKTTIIRMISCVSPLTSGKLRVDGLDVTRDQRRIKAMLGVVPQTDNIDPDLSVIDNLLVYARYFNLPPKTARQRAEELLALFQLLDRQHSRVDDLSGGMTRRLLIARALLNQPKIIILDEPTGGLDPQARHLVWQKLNYLKSQGTTLLLSTHNMEEAARLCDRVIIMHLGRILAQGKPRELVARYAGDTVLELHLEPPQKETIREQLKSRDVGVAGIEDALFVFAPDGRALLDEMGIPLAKAVQRPANLEDVFLLLTGVGLADQPV